MDELQAAQHLVQEELVMLRRQVVIRLDDLVQVLTVSRRMAMRARQSLHTHPRPITRSRRTVSMSSNTM